VLLGGLLTTIALNMLAVPALLPRFGVEWPGAAGPRPVLERVG
jgi:hypothetical protein